MSKAAVNGIGIEYETSGDPAARPLLMIGGLATQLIHWDEDLCRDLAQRGHYVIRFDNRDAGLSTKCDEPNQVNLAQQRGLSSPPYTLDDMADDAVGLLDALGIGKAHICGTSMGGMIAQTVAIRHPSRVLSLISIYSTTGNSDLPPPKPEVIELLLAPAPRERDAYLQHMVLLYKAMAGRGFAFDEAWARMITGKAYDRSPCGTGTSAKLACLYGDGKLQVGQIWKQQSVVGSIFEGSVQLVGEKIIPTITGEAWVMAEGVILVDDRDPFGSGI